MCKHKWVEKKDEPVSTLVESGKPIAFGKLYICEVCGLKHEIGASIFYLMAMGRFRGDVNKILEKES